MIAGDVRVGGRPASKPGELVADEAEVAVTEPPPYVSRGGVKLANALDAFGIDPSGRRALDVGASTGGFTDCLLQRGAAAVIALDVAYGELHWRLRNDERVTVIERRNARSLEPAELPFAPDLIVADVSFISLTQGAARPWWRQRRRASTCSPWSSPSSRWAASAWARAAWCARAEDRRAALLAVAEHARQGPGRVGARLRLLRAGRARPGTARASSGSPRRAREGALEDLEAAARRAEP